MNSITRTRNNDSPGSQETSSKHCSVVQLTRRALIVILLFATEFASGTARLAGSADNDKKTTRPDSSDAVVLIYATIDKSLYVGTGFFCESTGEIVTAYHVVQGASSVEIAGANRLYTKEASIWKYNPKWDIAVLKAGLKPRHHLKLAESVPEQLTKIKKGRAFAFGNPDGNRRFRVPVSFPRDEVIDTGDWRPIGVFFHLFEKIIPIELTFDGGMSGGPVIVDDKVIGVLSGGRRKGGRDFGWAIPVDYIAKLPEGTTGKTFVDLPKLNLFRAGVAPARLKATELVSRASDDFFRKAGEVRKRLVAQKAKTVKLKKILSLPAAGREELEQAMKTLKEIIGEMGPSSDTTVQYMEWTWRVYKPSLERLAKKRKLPVKDAIAMKYGKKSKELEADLTRLSEEYNKRSKAFAESSKKLHTQGEATKHALARLIDKGMDDSDEALGHCAKLFDAYLEKLGADVALLEGVAMVLQISAEAERHLDQLIRESDDGR